MTIESHNLSACFCSGNKVILSTLNLTMDHIPQSPSETTQNQRRADLNFGHKAASAHLHFIHTQV